MAPCRDTLTGFDGDFRTDKVLSCTFVSLPQSVLQKCPHPQPFFLACNMTANFFGTHWTCWNLGAVFFTLSSAHVCNRSQICRNVHLLYSLDLDQVLVEIHTEHVFAFQMQDEWKNPHGLERLFKCWTSFNWISMFYVRCCKRCKCNGQSCPSSTFIWKKHWNNSTVKCKNMHCDCLLLYSLLLYRPTI